MTDPRQKRVNRDRYVNFAWRCCDEGDVSHEVGIDHRAQHRLGFVFAHAAAQPPYAGFLHAPVHLRACDEQAGKTAQPRLMADQQRV